MLSIDIVYPHLPPAVNGIGDHSVLLARALVQQGHRVRLLGALAPGQGEEVRDGWGVEAVDAWPSGRLADTDGLLDALLGGGADVVLLQFEQFSYGTRGWNPALSRVFGELRDRMPAALRVLYAHENYTYPGSLGRTVTWAYQRRQFLRLARDAQRVVVTTEAWTQRDRLPGAVVLPVFSNIPDPASTAPASPGVSPLVWFGYLDPQRLPYFETVLSVLAGGAAGRRLVYVGVDGSLARSAAHRLGFEGLTTVDSPPASEVSRILQGADLVLAPFPDGVSSRRGTVMAALQHGRTVVTNRGPSTDALMLDLIQEGVVLSAEDTSTAAFSRILARVLHRPAGEVAELSERAAETYAARFSPAVAAASLVSVLQA